MTWPTHQAGAVVGGLLLNLSLPALGAAFLGAVVPDIIDQSISRIAPGKCVRQKIFNKIHRGQSHWAGWWLLLFLLPLSLNLPLILRDILAGLALGALSHVVMDMLTPRGVPLFPFGSSMNLAIPVCSTGKASEYVFLGLILMVGFFCIFSITPIQGGLIARFRTGL